MGSDQTVGLCAFLHYQKPKRTAANVCWSYLSVSHLHYDLPTECFGMDNDSQPIRQQCLPQLDAF